MSVPPEPGEATAPRAAVLHSAVLHRDLTRDYKFFVRGEGCYLIDAAGRRFLDAAGGVAVNIVGHGERRIIDALAAHADEVSYVYGAAFTSPWQERLARILADVTPLADPRVFFCSGGSEANETAVKLARQYHVERGDSSRWKVISRWQGYHGNTLAMLSVSGRPSWRSIYDPYLLAFPHIDPPYCYRCPYGASFPSCGIACAEDLERTIRLEGPETIAAFIAEPVIGTSVTGVVPVPGYYARIREICDAHGILFIADEVLCGYGRTGRECAIDHWGVVPDIITMGKAIGSGYAALAACVAAGHVVEALRDGSGQFVHGFTYSGLPMSCFIGVEVHQMVRDLGLFDRAADMGSYLFKQLARLWEHPIVGDVRGLGLLAGVELVADRATRRPFPSELEVTERVVATAEERGVLLRQGAAGANYGNGGDHIQITPPYVITPGEIDELVAVLDDVLRDLSAELS
jgi:adenosylmethionine-8-amino-7-oxononanoate aminotransferase